MVEDWKLKSVERRIDSLEKSIERDRNSDREEKDKVRAEKWRRQERRMDVAMAILWTAYVAAMTTCIVLAATGQLHHH